MFKVTMIHTEITHVQQIHKHRNSHANQIASVLPDN